MRRREKHFGFTLVEVIVVLVILAILAAILIPAMVKWIDEANTKVCESNRRQIERYWQYEQTLYYAEYGQNVANVVTLEKVLAADTYAETKDDVAMLKKCPSGGAYSVSGSHVTCSKHGEDGGGSDVTYTNETIGAAVGTVLSSGSPALSMNVSSIYSSVNQKYNESAQGVRDLFLADMQARDPALATFLSQYTWTVSAQSGALKSDGAYNLYFTAAPIDGLSYYSKVSGYVYNSLTGTVTASDSLHVYSATDPITKVRKNYIGR